ncbi:MAG: ferritin-like domain-containing protein [Deltaproteobacteria bacterium]|nr:MAG: ferritin-like domain-containing protein [Deltaproteobacteria bacterium]
MGTMQWIEHFRDSVARPREADWSRGVHLDAELREPVLRSLQAFQRGLSSPGTDLRTKVRRGADADYAVAVDLYVQEKNIHADLLARLLWAAQSEPYTRRWPDFFFRRLRRRFDWAPEMMILLTAEMASMPFFRTLANHAGDPLLREVLEGILQDQAFHIGFHIDHLRPEMERRGGKERVVLQHAWGTFFSATLMVLIQDNTRVFDALGHQRIAYWTDAWNLFAQVQSGLHGSRNLGALLGRDPRIRFVV